MFTKIKFQNDYRQCLHVVSDFGSLRDYFQTVWEKIIFKDIKYACAKEIDKRLWAIIKKPLEHLSKEKKKDEEARHNLLKHVGSNI